MLFGIHLTSSFYSRKNQFSLKLNLWDNVHVILITLKEPVFFIKFFKEKGAVKFDLKEWTPFEQHELFVNAKNKIGLSIYK